MFKFRGNDRDLKGFCKCSTINLEAKQNKMSLSAPALTSPRKLRPPNLKRKWKPLSTIKNKCPESQRYQMHLYAVAFRQKPPDTNPWKKFMIGCTDIHACIGIYKYTNSRILDIMQLHKQIPITLHEWINMIWHHAHVHLIYIYIFSIYDDVQSRKRLSSSASSPF